MSAYDTPLTDELRCPDCAHPEGCPCSCCPAAIEAALMAELLDNMGAAALRDRDYEAMENFWQAADLTAAPSDATVTARMLLLEAAAARNGG